MERKQSSHIEKVILFFFIKFTTVELISPRTQRTYFKHSNASINRNLNLSKKKKIEKKIIRKEKRTKPLFLFLSLLLVVLFVSLEQINNLTEWTLLINNYLRFFRSCFTFQIISSIHAMASSALSCPSTKNQNQPMNNDNRENIEKLTN